MLLAFSEAFGFLKIFFVVGASNAYECLCQQKERNWRVRSLHDATATALTYPKQLCCRGYCTLDRSIFPTEGKRLKIEQRDSYGTFKGPEKFDAQEKHSIQDLI